jgi:hypothetical protein
VVTTSFLTSASYSTICSTTCRDKIVIFSLLSCASCFTFPRAITNSLITLSASSSSDTNRCWRIFCWSHIFLISLYDCLCTNMVVMHSIGGKKIDIFQSLLCFFMYIPHSRFHNLHLWVLHQVCPNLKTFLTDIYAFLIQLDICNHGHNGSFSFCPFL